MPSSVLIQWDFYSNQIFVSLLEFVHNAFYLFWAFTFNRIHPHFQCLVVVLTTIASLAASSMRVGVLSSGALALLLFVRVV